MLNLGVSLPAGAENIVAEVEQFCEDLRDKVAELLGHPADRIDVSLQFRQPDPEDDEGAEWDAAFEGDTRPLTEDEKAKITRAVVMICDDGGV